jgi:hypothetical protein
MAAEQSSAFPWLIWHHGDPGPPIWEIIQELGEERQRKIVGILIEGQVAALTAQITTLKGIQGAIGE